jgi:hypothetical protein
MSEPTRLDVVVRLRERSEELAQVSLAQATRAFVDAEAWLAQARAKAAADARGPASACEWLIAEEAHHRALCEVRAARADLERARSGREQARAACVEAHQNTEVVRRAQGRKRDEQRLAEGRAARKHDDSLALLLRAG